MTFVDKLGREIKEGDYIAYAAMTAKHSCSLLTYKVIGFYPSGLKAIPVTKSQHPWDNEPRRLVCVHNVRDSKAVILDPSYFTETQ